MYGITDTQVRQIFGTVNENIRRLEHRYSRHLEGNILFTINQTAKRGGIASSGDYERSIRIGNRNFSHLLDPKTGWPVSGLSVVSVIADFSPVAGSASTIAMLKGAGGANWLRANPVSSFMGGFRRSD